MVDTVASTFGAKGVSAWLSLGNSPEDVTYAITNTFSATWQIERARTPDGTAWEIVAGPFTTTGSGTVRGRPHDRFRARCVAYTSGTITYTMSDSNAIVSQIKDQDGNVAMTITQASVSTSFAFEAQAGGTLAGSFVIGDVGATASALTSQGTALTPNFEMVGTSAGKSTFALGRFTASANSPRFGLFHSRGATVGAAGALVAADAVGEITFYGNDGTDFLAGAWIKTLVNNTVSTGVVPMTITFGTAASGSSPTERMRIDENGNVGIGASVNLSPLTVAGRISRGIPIGKTTSFTLAATEANIVCNGAGSITVTLPAASTVPGAELLIKTVAAQTVVSATSNIVPMVGGAAGTAILAGTAGKWALLVADGTNWTIMAGN